MANKKNKGIQIPKIIIYIGKVLYLLSPALATKYAIKLFATPIKHKSPKREWHMEEEAVLEKIKLPNSNKEITSYQYGKSDKKILLAHGWSGRGTQLVKIADALLKNGYSTISFDAPAHGKSAGKQSNMVEFIEAIHLLEEEHGPFEFAIGHSLGGMAVLNAISQNLAVKKAICIGCADLVSDIVDDFITKLKLDNSISKKIQQFYENKIGRTMNSYSSSTVATKIKIPVLVIHDHQDLEVPYSCATNICNTLSNGTLFATSNLGHRKILGDTQVIKQIITFITK